MQVGKLLGLLILAGMGQILPSAAQDQFSGKRLTIVVGFAAGGGNDVAARLLARALPRHLAGEPSVIIQNMPGAAGATALGYLAHRAPKDGTVLAYDSWTPLEQVTSSHRPFDYLKMSLVAAMHGGPYVVFGRKDMVPGGMTRSADIAKAGQLIYGGQQPSLTLDIHGRIGLNILGINYKYIAGYVGAGLVRQALARGEVQITTHGLQGYRSGVEPDLVKSGVAMPLWYFPGRNKSGDFVPSPLVPDMPTFQDVYKQVRGDKKNELDWAALELMSDFYSVAHFLWAPPDADPKALAVLRSAVQKSMADPEFIDEQKRVFGFAYTHVPQDEAEKIVSRLKNVPPELVEYFRKLMQ
ncbi:MAG: hypothetical protein BGP04_21075 [Rhizobiales bacterium 62-17]|nr:hypothetical protein [Hyphomicrobiales bacterium]OJY00110.1 MAG: hypothetical protein BGP04_21075 [Rhizobiales bacterium 62-17]